MTAPGAVPSREAEDAGALLMRTVGHYRTAQASIPDRRGPRRLGLPAPSPSQERAQATLVRLMSITEAYTADTLLRHAEPSAAGSGHPVAVAVYDDAAVAAVRDWRNMRDAYKRWLLVTWEKAAYNPVFTLADARNAVVHGLGTLTRQQTRSNPTGLRTRLAAAGAVVGPGDALFLPDPFVVAAARACRTFVEHVDVQVRQRPADRR